MPGRVQSSPRNLAEHAHFGIRGKPRSYVSVFGRNGADTETRRSRWARVAVALAIGVGTLGLAYIVYVAVTWYQYGRVENAPDSASKSRLDQFMPIYEVGEVHEIQVTAPAELTFAAAQQLDLQRSPLVQAIFTARTLPGRLRGEEPVSFARGILDETRSIGWGTLADVPGEEVIMGAVTRPWDSSPTFQALPPDEFASFNEPGYAKIVWTLSVEPRGDEHSIFRTVTRVQTTDPESRQKFRRYWATLSPGDSPHSTTGA